MGWVGRDTKRLPGGSLLGFLEGRGSLGLFIFTEHVAHMPSSFKFMLKKRNLLYPICEIL